jgi:hypothetical protein
MSTASTNSMALTDHPATPDDARRRLKVYLRDHRGGATFGQSLARRSQEANAGTELGDTLAVVAREIEEDCRSLDSIMARLGIKPSMVKLAFAKVADVAARPKLHGRLQPCTPVSRVLQLEALTASILTKRHLWQALAAVAAAGEIPSLDRDELARLIGRSDAQIDRLEVHHAPASRSAFGAGAALSPDVR